MSIINVKNVNKFQKKKKKQYEEYRSFFVVKCFISKFVQTRIISLLIGDIFSNAWAFLKRSFGDFDIFDWSIIFHQFTRCTFFPRTYRWNKLIPACQIFRVRNFQLSTEVHIFFRINATLPVFYYNFLFFFYSSVVLNNNM